VTQEQMEQAILELQNLIIAMEIRIKTLEDDVAKVSETSLAASITTAFDAALKSRLSNH
jgi:hypothetical protein